MDDKKLYKLDLSIAVEASNAKEAFDILVTDETLKHVRELIIQSKDNIKEMFEKEDNPAIINLLIIVFIFVRF